MAAAAAVIALWWLESLDESAQDCVKGAVACMRKRLFL